MSGWKRVIFRAETRPAPTCVVYTDGRARGTVRLITVPTTPASIMAKSIARKIRVHSSLPRRHANTRRVSLLPYASANLQIS